MRLFFLISFFILNNCWAEVGKVLKTVGANDAYLMRAQTKILLSPELELEVGDQLFSQNAYTVVHLYPGTQISLAQNTQIIITELLIEENEEGIDKSSSIIDFVTGIIRTVVTREGEEVVDQKIKARGVAFGVRGTEFEISQDGSDEVDLDVFEGSVEVTSPDVHTFVPEIVNANEGFKYNRKQKLFSRRKFAPKFKNHPGFQDKKRLRLQWKELKKKRRAGTKKNRKKLIKLKKEKDRGNNPRSFSR
jgi:hypothetical protein